MAERAPVPGIVALPPERAHAHELWIWRHPRATGALGRCIGRTDLPVDRRRAKRLAHRIRAAARRHGLPRQVLTSPLQRARAVGRWLQRWGWRHRVQPQLLEMDFGRWDGRPWETIARDEIDAWCAGFDRHRPGGGESLGELFARCAAWRHADGPVCVVGHGGWMLARRWLTEGRPLPTQAAEWPPAPAHGSVWRLPATLPPWHAPQEAAA